MTARGIRGKASLFGSNGTVDGRSDITLIPTRHAATCLTRQVLTRPTRTALSRSNADQRESTLATRLGATQRPTVIVQPLNRDNIIRLESDLIVKRSVVWVDSNDGLSWANVVRRVLVLNSRDGSTATIGTSLAAHSTVGALLGGFTALSGGNGGATSEGARTSSTGEFGVGRRTAEFRRLDHSFLALNPGALDVALVSSVAIDGVLLGIALLTAPAEEEESEEGAEESSADTASDDDTGELAVAKGVFVGADEHLTIGGHVVVDVSGASNGRRS